MDRNGTLLSKLFDKLQEAKFDDDKITFIDTKVTEEKEVPEVNPELEKAADAALKDSEKKVETDVKDAEQKTEKEEVKTQLPVDTAAKDDVATGTKKKELAEAFDVDQSVVDQVVKDMDIDVNTIDIEQLKKGLKIEQEHEDITGGDKVLTAKIALAHIKEIPDYYDRLTKMENDYKAEVTGEKEEVESPEEVKPAEEPEKEEPKSEEPEKEEKEEEPEESKVTEAETKYRVVATGISDKGIASRMANQERGLVWPDATDKTKFQVVVKESVNEQSGIRDKLIRMSIAKPTNWEEAETRNISRKLHADFINKLPEIQLDGSNPLDDKLIPDEMRSNSVIVKVNDKQYYVDPQGYGYARYAALLTENEEDEWDPEALATSYVNGNISYVRSKVQQCPKTMAKTIAKMKEMYPKQLDRFIQLMSEKKESAVNEMKVTALAVDWKENFSAKDINSAARAVGGKKVVHDFDGHGSDSKVMIVSSDELTDEQMQQLWDAGDFFLGDKVWSGKDVSDIASKLSVHMEKETKEEMGEAKDKKKKIGKKRVNEKSERFGKTVVVEVEQKEEDGTESIVPYTVELSLTIASDPNYGADADGHRGMYQEWIDDWEIVSITDQDGNKVTETPEIISAIENKLDDIDLSEFGDNEPDPEDMEKPAEEAKGDDEVDIFDEAMEVAAMSTDQLAHKLGLDHSVAKAIQKAIHYAAKQKKLTEATGKEWTVEIAKLTNNERTALIEALSRLLGWKFFEKEYGWTGLSTIKAYLEEENIKALGEGKFKDIDTSIKDMIDKKMPEAFIVNAVKKANPSLKDDEIKAVIKSHMSESKVNEQDTKDIKVKHPDILNVPEDKKFWQLPLGHYIGIAKKKGKPAVMRALLNIARWNKTKAKDVSQHAKEIVDSLKNNKEWIALSASESITEARKKEYKDLAERLLIVEHLKSKTGLNEREKKFINETLSIKLTDVEREIVFEQYLDITKK